jgi:hypothetical protein
MAGINWLAVAAAVVAAFVISTVWYSIFGKQMVELRGGSAEAAADTGAPAPGKIALELSRSLVLATVVAWLAARMDVTDWSGGLQLGLVAWLGFAAMLLTVSVLWENVAPRLAAIHAGDWLLKLATVGVLVGAWQ